MNCLQTRNNRRYLLFLGCLCALLLGLSLGSHWWLLIQCKQLLITQEQTMASALLAQDISPTVIAQALSNDTSTADGMALLQQLGRTETISLLLFPPLQGRLLPVFCSALLTPLLIGLLLFGGSIFFLTRQEHLYQQAIAVLRRFAAEDFSCHLPRGHQGGLYQLFAMIDQLAMALQAKTELEQQAKLFLQDAISDISHQLKTPLAALTMYTEIMANEADNAPLVQTFTQKSACSLARMEQLLQTLLKIMRLDAGTILFEKNSYPVHQLVEQAVDQLLTRAAQEQKQICITGDAADRINCDLDWTREALCNLIKNGLDHTEAGGTVSVSWQSTPMLLRFTIQDNGCGIAPEDFHHIFKRFYRSAQAKQQTGVGLGLPLAKAIIEGQNGTISVQSALGEGTAFFVSFPIQQYSLQNQCSLQNCKQPDCRS